MKIKTSELTGAALDWAVAMAENWAGADFENKPYSTDWSQGGPIIEREHISVEATRVGGLGDRWMADIQTDCTQFADKPLIAAMRCYVASKLGDDVDVPEELCPPTA
jgi:hypothetical protein